jgi:hypothetical protein
MKIYVFLYLLFCLVGAGLEWCYGAFWDLVGVAPWTYPGSPLHYTSLEMLPLWGAGGLICVFIYRSATQRSAKPLAGVIIALALATLWISLFSFVR